jgi:hypothetical protein
MAGAVRSRGNCGTSTGVTPRSGNLLQVTFLICAAGFAWHEYVRRFPVAPAGPTGSLAGWLSRGLRMLGSEERPAGIVVEPAAGAPAQEQGETNGEKEFDHHAQSGRPEC